MAAAAGADLGFGWEAPVVVEGCAGQEPFFFDEAEAAADHERRMRREQEAAAEAQRPAMDRISDCDLKQEGQCSTQFLFGGFSASDSDDESPPRLLGRSVPAMHKYDDDDEEFAGLEPFFFDEAEAVADHERRMQRVQEEARQKELLDHRRKVRKAALDKIREYDPKMGCTYFSRIYFVDLSTFDLDEESPFGPMRYTKASIEVHGNVCKEEGRQFYPGESANILAVKIASSDVGFPIDVYGTVIARDSLDRKCVYLFQRDRDHCQLIKSKNESLILTGPKRGLVLIDGIYFETDLKMKVGRGHKDKQFSKGLLELNGMTLESHDKMVVKREYLDSKLSKVVIMFAVVKFAVEATIAIEVLQGRFFGEITACTTSIQSSIVLYNSKVAGAKNGNGEGAIHLSRPVVAVYLKEKLIVTIAARSGVGRIKNTMKFTPRGSGDDENEITCGSLKMRVKVTWSIMSRHYMVWSNDPMLGDAFVV